ncbi:uncharacterized protein LOC143905554 [Temnothorax americanus]|uniref:uncharacterized protein LOC143905554 n=1 Tax=Temnothorax americanus TaxID=1964332 RepID=UPI0040680C7E
MPDKSKKNLAVMPTNKPSAHAVDDLYLACHTVFHGSYQISSHTTKSRGWILDSGCTAHLCGDKSLFSSLDSSRRGRLSLASEASTTVEGKGAVKLPVSNTHDKGGSVIFRNDSAVVVDQKGTIKMEAVRQGDLYIIKEDNDYADISDESQTTSAIWIWHNRLGHLNAKDLFKVMTDQGLPLPSKVEVDGLKQCEICLKGKMTALPFPKENLSAQNY